MRFLVSGSSNLLLMKRVTETLAGRTVYFEMPPMTYGEIKENHEGQIKVFYIYTGNVLNQTDIARDTGVTQPTVYRYKKLLEVSNILNRIPPFYSNKMKRITNAVKEVDFVIEHGKKLLALEVKLSKNPTFSDIKTLLAFIEIFPNVNKGILIHAGGSIKWLHSKAVAVPWFWIA